MRGATVCLCMWCYSPPRQTGYAVPPPRPLSVSVILLPSSAFLAHPHFFLPLKPLHLLSPLLLPLASFSLASSAQLLSPSYSSRKHLYVRGAPSPNSFSISLSSRSFFDDDDDAASDRPPIPFTCNLIHAAAEHAATLYLAIVMAYSNIYQFILNQIFVF